MKIEIREATDKNIRFFLHSPISFANSIRRILLSEVPGTAIDLIEIKENVSVFADEMLANRLGLVPIYHKNNLIMKEECDCDNYCKRCSIVFLLCKKNTGTETISVTGQDLVCEDPGVVCHNSLIAKLAPGQMIDVKCIARTGLPMTHAKYCPVSAVTFNYDKRNKHRETNLWFEEDIKSEWPMINQTDDVDWNECMGVEMDVEIVEGSGNPKEILLKALEIFKSKIGAILERLE